MTELRKQINNIVEDHQACLTLAKSMNGKEVYEGTTATAQDIVVGKTAYSNGELLEGTLAIGSNNIYASTDNYDKFPSNLLNPNHFTVAKLMRTVDLSNCDFSNITQYTNAFNGCSFMTTLILPESFLTGCTSAYYTFYTCCSLEEAPYFNTSKVENMNGMFGYCLNLVTVPVYETNNVTGGTFSSLFTQCEKLSDESLNNILQMCINAKKVTGTTYKTLKSLGLSESQAERCQTLSNYQAFLNAGWKTGY